MARVLTLFVAAVTEHLTRSNSWVERSYPGSQFEGMVDDDRGGVEAGLAALCGNKSVRWLAHTSADWTAERRDCGSQ